MDRRLLDGRLLDGRLLDGRLLDRRWLDRRLLDGRRLGPENPDQVRRHAVGAHRRNLDDVAHLQHLALPEV
ncbi:Uncharacterised protein [Mycobacterium tuberculosis]|nr:Uncharacterised protein [Mycobacterium tuberculosis]